MNLGETYMSLPNDLSGSASKNRFRLELCPPSKNRHKKASKNEMNRSISLIC